MKIKELKLYNKYTISNSDIKLIYIGIDNEEYYWFIYKNENSSVYYLPTLRYNGLNPDKITKDLNLEIYIHVDGNKYIKGYNYTFYSKETIETYFKPYLKDKINNIINR